MFVRLGHVALLVFVTICAASGLQPVQNVRHRKHGFRNEGRIGTVPKLCVDVETILDSGAVSAESRIQLGACALHGNYVQTVFASRATELGQMLDTLRQTSTLECFEAAAAFLCHQYLRPCYNDDGKGGERPIPTCRPSCLAFVHKCPGEKHAGWTHEKCVKSMPKCGCPLAREFIPIPEICWK